MGWAAALGGLWLSSACALSFDPALIPPADAGAPDAGPVAMPDGGPPAGDCPQSLASETEEVTEPEAGPVPATGERFTDPTWGTCGRRLTGQNGMDTLTRTLQTPFNADSSRVLLLQGAYEYLLYDVASTSLVAETGIFRGANPHWDPSDPNRLLHLAGASLPIELRRIDVETGARDVVADLTEELVALFPAAASATAADLMPSADLRLWPLRLEDGAGDTVGVVVVDPERSVGTRVVGSLAGEQADRVRSVAVSPDGSRVVVDDCEGALSSYSLQFDDARVLVEQGCQHPWTLAATEDGDHIVYADRQQVRARGLNSGEPFSLFTLLGEPAVAPTQRTEVRLTATSVDRPGFVVATFWACRDLLGEACEDGAQWAKDHSVLLEVADGGRLFNLGWHRDRSNKSSAVANRDLSQVLFLSGWGDERVDAFVWEVPPGTF